MERLKQARKLFYDNFHLCKKCLGNNDIVGLHELESVPQVIKNIRNQIIEDQKLQNTFNNPELKDFIVYIENGRYLEPHTDFLAAVDAKKYNHYRANWVVQVPEKDVFLFANEGECYRLEEDKIYMVNAKQYHCVSKVYGETPLVIYSFGFLERL